MVAAVPKASQRAIMPLGVILLTFVGVDILLLANGVLWHPAALSNGLALALLMQGAYASSVLFGLIGRHDSVENRFGLVFGGLIALVFVAEISLELLITISDNTPLGQAEFGTVFILLFLTGLITAWRSGSIQSAVGAAIGAALLGSVIWAVLLSYYLFHATPQMQQSFQAEGTFDDFRQSGMTDFIAFVLQDYWGAGFYHLLLAPFVALALGGAGALIGQTSRQFWRSRARA